MKILIVLLFLLPAVASAQELKGDTLVYNGQQYYRGKELQLSYGRNLDSTFIFAFRNTIWNLPGQELDRRWTNRKLVVNRIIKKQNKYFLKCAVPETGGWVMVDIVGARSNEEVQ